MPANSDQENDDMNITTNIAYGTLAHQSVNNPLYVITPSRNPPIYSVPRPTCSPPKSQDSKLPNGYTALTDRSSCSTNSLDSAPGHAPSPNHQAHPAYYESIELLVNDPLLKQKEPVVSIDTNLDHENSDDRYAVPTSTRSVCTGQVVTDDAVCYNKLQHSDTAETTFRLATIPDSGYEALETKS